MRYETGKEIPCPLATAPEPVFEQSADGMSAADLVGRLVQFPNGKTTKIRESDAALIDATGAGIPEGTLLASPSPLEGVRHSAVFEEMPFGYATKRWGGAREEVPYLRCPVCRATFPKWGIEEYLAGLGG